ncbi:hypothetical protein GHR37_26340 [Achromobacter xylosoxidans]|nr:hypothetical protein [Achromobacter xylosoxidans]
MNAVLRLDCDHPQEHGYATAVGWTSFLPDLNLMETIHRMSGASFDRRAKQWMCFA